MDKRSKPVEGETVYVWVAHRHRFPHTTVRIERYVLIEKTGADNVRVMVRGLARVIRKADHIQFFFTEEEVRAWRVRWLVAQVGEGVRLLKLAREREAEPYREERISDEPISSPEKIILK